MGSRLPGGEAAGFRGNDNANLFILHNYVIPVKQGPMSRRSPSAADLRQTMSCSRRGIVQDKHQSFIENKILHQGVF